MGSFTMFGVFVAAVAVVLAVKSYQNTKKRKEGEKNADIQATTEDVYVDTGFKGSKDFFLAGVQHHCTRSDIGFFTGVVYNDNGNIHDRKAMAVWCHQTDKALGFVPASVLDEYWTWSDGKKCTCVGYLFFDGEMIRGRVRAYLPSCDHDAVMKDIVEYAKQVCGHFGWSVPSFVAV